MMGASLPRTWIIFISFCLAYGHDAPNDDVPCEPTKIYHELVNLCASNSTNAAFSRIEILEAARLRYQTAKDAATDIVASRVNVQVNSEKKNWTQSLFAPSLREFHDARRAYDQALVFHCPSTFQAGIPRLGCYLENSGAGGRTWMSSTPLAWASDALKVQDLATRPEVMKRCCSARLLCLKRKPKAMRGASANNKSVEIQSAIVSIEAAIAQQQTSGHHLKLETTTPTAAAGRARATLPPDGPVLCVSGAPVHCSFELLSRFVEAWSQSTELNSGESLATKRHIRVYSAGDDSVMPTTEARDGVGLPRMFRAGTESLKSNGVLPFNNVSDAFDDFHSWEDRDYFLAQEPENARTRPDRHFMPSLLKFDALGFNYTWFASNLVATHHKLKPLPIGVDAHFMRHLEFARKRLIADSLAQTSQERVPSNSNFRKKSLLLLNFKPSSGLQGSSEREGIYRLAVLGSLGGNNNDTREFGLSPPAEQKKDLRQSDRNHVHPWKWATVEPRFATKWDTDDIPSYFLALAQHHFVLSPRGNGLDCFRTWEALSVGTIPIVKRSGSFDQAYDGLPVLLVDRWQDVTLELLLNTLAAWQDTPFPNLSVLSWRHWA